MEDYDDDFDEKEYEKERKEEEEGVTNLPIVKKAEDLFFTINAFVEWVATFDRINNNLGDEWGIWTDY